MRVSNTHFKQHVQVQPWSSLQACVRLCRETVLHPPSQAVCCCPPEATSEPHQILCLVRTWPLSPRHLCDMHRAPCSPQSRFCSISSLLLHLTKCSQVVLQMYKSGCELALSSVLPELSISPEWKRESFWSRGLATWCALPSSAFPQPGFLLLSHCWSWAVISSCLTASQTVSFPATHVAFYLTPSRSLSRFWPSQTHHDVESFTFPISSANCSGLSFALACNIVTNLFVPITMMKILPRQYFLVLFLTKGNF